VAAYVLFLRPTFTVLYDEVREADAAQIVAELERAGIEYQLEDNGRRVLVPEGEAGRARVLVAGSGIALGGVVGFELFNENDMGLTEFSQKVNYQRALQGELARTIMAMDGVEYARVHLSLPERALFRASRQTPKAAVTVQTDTGRALDADRVVGIQQLVSSTVPELAAYHVAVLDERGRLLSEPPSSDGDRAAGPLSEKQALEEYYRARLRAAAERLIPGLPFELRVLALELPDAAPSSDQAAPADYSAEARNFQLRIAFRTEAALNAEDRQLLRSAITEAAGLVPARGDVLRFENGAIDSMGAAVPPPFTRPAGTEANEPPVSLSAPARETELGWLLANRWLWLALALLVVLALIRLRRRSRLSGAEHQSFADMLNDRLAVLEEAPDAR